MWLTKLYLALVLKGKVGHIGIIGTHIMSNENAPRTKDLLPGYVANSEV